jgi:hypothetical protein
VFLEIATAFDTAMVADLVLVILVTTGTEVGAVKQTGRLLSTFICSAVAEVSTSSLDNSDCLTYIKAVFFPRTVN